MTPREQLEYAAKAMGLAGRWHKREHEYAADDGFLLFTGVRWSPDTDQADSDRMGAKLRINILYQDGVIQASAKDCDSVKYVFHNNTDEDVFRAVREARLAVAVEIGKGMK